MNLEHIPLQKMPPIVRGFFTAAFWTADDEAPGGMDYRDTGNADDLFDRLHPANKEKMTCRVLDWAAANQSLLDEAMEAGLDEDQLGHDLHLTAQGHGVGFWDRDLDELGERLTAAAKRFGHYDVSIDGDGVFIE